jgi:hypothetical protein
MTILHPDGNTNHRSGAEAADGVRRNRCDESAVGQAARTDLHGFEQSWKSAARADGIYQVSLCEDDRFAGSKVGGHDGKGNSQVFELARFKHPPDQIAETLVAGQSQAGNTPAGDVAKAQRPARLHNARERRAAGVSSAQDAAHAGPGNVRDGDLILFKDLEDAEVCKTAGETST